MSFIFSETYWTFIQLKI